jgi:hypothetical protein
VARFQGDEFREGGGHQPAGLLHTRPTATKAVFSEGCCAIVLASCCSDRARSAPKRVPHSAPLATELAMWRRCTLRLTDQNPTLAGNEWRPWLPTLASACGSSAPAPSEVLVWSHSLMPASFVSLGGTCSDVSQAAFAGGLLRLRRAGLVFNQ